MTLIDFAIYLGKCLIGAMMLFVFMGLMIVLIGLLVDWWDRWRT